MTLFTAFHWIALSFMSISLVSSHWVLRNMKSLYLLYVSLYHFLFFYTASLSVLFLLTHFWFSVKASKQRSEVRGCCLCVFVVGIARYKRCVLPSAVMRISTITQLQCDIVQCFHKRKNFLSQAASCVDRKWGWVRCYREGPLVAWFY